jgi:hypothetical protein
MVQFYFLSILFNLVGGASLVLVSMPTRSAGIQGLKTFLRDPSVCLVTGILASVIGALKLLTAMRGDIPVVGDFLPAMAGLAVGSTLLLERFRDPDFAPPSARAPGGPAAGKVAGSAASAPAGDAGAEAGDASAEAGAASAAASVAPEKAEARKGLGKVERYLLDHKMAVGLAGLIAAGVHFLFPMVLFL